MMGFIEDAERLSAECLHWAKQTFATSTSIPSLRGVALIHHSAAKAFISAHPSEKKVAIAHSAHALTLQISAAEQDPMNASIKNELAETILFISTFFMTLPRPDLSDLDAVLQKTRIHQNVPPAKCTTLGDLMKQLFCPTLMPRTLGELLFYCWRLSTDCLTTADCLTSYARLRIACKDTGDVQSLLTYAHSLFNRYDDVYGQAECYRLMSSAKWKNVLLKNAVVDASQADPREVSLSLLLLDRAARMFEQCGKTEYATRCRIVLSKRHGLVMQNEELRALCFQRQP